MKLSKIVTGAALPTVLGAGAASAFAGEMSNMPPAAIQAVVVPTPGQAQHQLTQVGRHLIEASAGHSTVLMPTRTSAPRK
jgi:hypothetical protein